jgi:hypothetical protein
MKAYEQEICMKTFQKMIVGVASASAALLMTHSAIAGGVNVDINLGAPGYYQAPTYYQPVYEQSRPYYHQRPREGEWRLRHVHARHWREKYREDRGYGEGRHDNRGEHRDHGRDERGDRGRHGY